MWKNYAFPAIMLIIAVVVIAGSALAASPVGDQIEEVATKAAGDVLGPTITPTAIATETPVYTEVSPTETATATLPPTATVCPIPENIQEMDRVEGYEAETFLLLEVGHDELVAQYNEENGTDLVPKSLILGPCEVPEVDYPVIPLATDGVANGMFLILDPNGYCLEDAGLTCNAVVYTTNWGLGAPSEAFAQDRVNRNPEIGQVGGYHTLNIGWEDTYQNLLEFYSVYEGLRVRVPEFDNRLVTNYAELAKPLILRFDEQLLPDIGLIVLNYGGFVEE